MRTDLRQKIAEFFEVLATSGDASQVRAQDVTVAKHFLFDESRLVSSIFRDAGLFIDDVLAEVTSDILASGGDMSEIGDKLESAYLAGLTKGLAVATAVCAN